MIWGARKEKRPIIPLQVIGQYLLLPPGRSWIFSTRNKTCRTCAASNKDKKCTPHDCCKNHCGCSEIIESNEAYELFKPAPAIGIKYDKCIGDADSKTFALVKTNVPYGLQKISDFVHTKRSLSTRLYNLSQCQKFPNLFVLLQKMGNYLVKCFEYCVHQHKNQPEELALYHMPLVTTTNVMYCGVATNKMLLNTPTMSYPMEGIFMGAAFNWHCKIFFLSILPQQLPQH